MGTKEKAWLEGHVGHGVPDPPFTLGGAAPRDSKKSWSGEQKWAPRGYPPGLPGGRIGSGRWGLGEYSAGGAGAGPRVGIDLGGREAMGRVVSRG